MSSIGNRCSQACHGAASASIESILGLGVPVRAQIAPMRIQRFNQCDALSASPRFNLLFSSNRVTHIAKSLEIHKLCNMVFLSESGNAPLLMLVHAALHVICNARIEHTGRARKDVYVIYMAPHGTYCATADMAIPLFALDRPTLCT